MVDKKDDWAWPGVVMQGLARFAKPWQAMALIGVAWNGFARHGTARHGWDLWDQTRRLGKPMPGLVWYGSAEQRMARFRLGSARHGSAG